MPKPIPFNLDAYGNYARASALADYIELAALNGTSTTLEAFADHLADAKATRKMDDMLVGDEDVGEGDDEAGEGATGEGPGVAQAKRVFDVLAERAEGLDHLYPFDLEEDALRAAPGGGANDSMYIALLSMTAAHAYSIEAPYDPKQVMEATVARSLGTIGLSWVNVGARSRKPETDFRDTIRAVGEAVALPSSPLAATTYKFANEEGVDCVGHLPAGRARRGGSWVFLGQVTCGDSESWEAKLDEPKPPLWQRVLNTGVLPQAFLAVPHHVERDHLGKLVTDADRVVLDRLRLTPLAGKPSAEENAIRAAVLAVGVEQLV